MTQTVGAFFWQRLYDWGVRRVFGYPGDGINGLLGDLQRMDGKIEFVQVRHEEMAAFMACAHAKFTGELGVCIATSGPGASHLLTGLYDARADHMPVLAIAGQSPRTVMGAHYQQEVDLQSMFKDVAADYVQTVMAPAQTRHVVDRAVRIALGKRAVTAIVFPHDVQLEAMEQPPRKHGSTFSGVGWSAPVTVPQPADLHRAAELLNGAQKVALLVGAGAKGATDEVIAVADALGAVAAKALLGKDVLPDDLPWVTGAIGLLGTKPSSDIMNACDALLMVGTGFPWAEFLPKDGSVPAVQIDLDPGMLGLRYPCEVNLQGDAKATLAALLPLLTRKSDTGWRETVKGWNDDWDGTVTARAHAKAEPVNPQRIFTELSPRLPDDAIITSDSGSCANWFARDLKLRRGMLASLSGGLASMGAAVPYAIGAKFAHPTRPVIATVGDGAMQMNNMAELLTVAKYWRGWADPRFIVCVLNNQDLNQVTWEQRVMEGNPKFEATQTLPDFAYHRFAELAGLKGLYVDDPEQLGAAWDEALAARVPVVLEVRCDPEVPPLPPHIGLEQAQKFMSMLVKGDPEQGHLLRDTARQVLASVLPTR
jgi:pyruvate dehydrogenase (quinone)